MHVGRQVAAVTAKAGGDVNAPLGGLPPTRRVLLARAPIEMALAEVRYSGGGEIPSADALTLRQALADAGIDLPRMVPAQQQQLAVTISPEGPASQIEVRSHGWQLASTDGALVVTVQPESLSVQCTRYVRWSESVRPALRAILDAVREVTAPQLAHRVGVRFVNRLVDDDARSPTAWSGRVVDEVLGAVLHPELGDKIVSTQQQLELRLGSAEGALIRHGAFVDASSRGSYSYLLDVDAFDSATVPFDPEALDERATTLNRTVLSLFQSVTTDRYQDSLGPYAELDEHGAVITQAERDEDAAAGEPGGGAR